MMTNFTQNANTVNLSETGDTAEKNAVLKEFPFQRLALTCWKVLLNLDFLAAWELQRIKKEVPQVRSCEETVERIIAGASIARYGDGEFAMVLGRRGPCPNSPLLQKRLLEILHVKPNEKFLVGIPPMLQLFEQSPKVKIPLTKRWQRFFQKNIKGNRDVHLDAVKWNFHEWFWIRSWRFLKRHLSEKLYDNSFVSRTEIFQSVPLEKIKRIWENRDVVFVVPKRGRYVYEERLFGNVKSADHIFIDALDTFATYEQILAESLTKEKDRLFLIAAGPTATVLAYDLYCSGYQALDIGHLPNCYQQYLGEQPAPERLIVQKNGVFLNGVLQERL